MANIHAGMNEDLLEHKSAAAGVRAVVREDLMRSYFYGTLSFAGLLLVALLSFGRSSARAQGSGAAERFSLWVR